MSKKKSGFKLIDLEKDLLINNFFSGKKGCKPKPVSSRPFLLSFLLVTIIALGAGIISMYAAGGSIPVSVTIPPSVSVNLTASPNPVVSGNNTTLTWTTTGSPTACTASDDQGNTIWSGSKGTSATNSESVGPLIFPTVYTFTIFCDTSPNSVVIVNVSSPVIPPAYTAPTVDLITDKTLVNAGETATLTWSSTNTAYPCTASGSWSGADKATNNSSGQLVTLPSTPGSYTYTLTCNGVSDSVMIDVGLPPVITFSSSKSSVAPGGGAILTWSSNPGTTSCTASTIFGASDWLGNVGLTGSQSIILPSTDGSYEYVLTCVNIFGSTSSIVTIQVITPPAPIVSPITPPVCGDNICEAAKGEDEISCPADCPPPSQPGRITPVRPQRPQQPVQPQPPEVVKKEIFKGTDPESPEVTIITTNPTVTLGDNKVINIAWSAPKAKTCLASGQPGWSGVKPNIGNENISTPKTPGEYTYVLTCDKTVAFSRINVLKGELENIGPTVPGVSKPGKLREFIVFNLVNNKNLWWLLLLLIPVLWLLYLIFRKKLVVYDSVTKKPIEGAKIELYREKVVIQTVLSNKKGIFKFKSDKIKEGNHYVIASKKGYLFPSNKLKGKQKDGRHKPLYFGTVFRIRKNQSIKMHIPLDLLAKK